MLSVGLKFKSKMADFHVCFDMFSLGLSGLTLFCVFVCGESCCSTRPLTFHTFRGVIIIKGPDQLTGSHRFYVDLNRLLL